MKFKPWKINNAPDSCECSQKATLEPTGYTSEQCSEYYCPVCRIGFWTVEFKPNAEQISYEKKSDPKATVDTMKYYALRKNPCDKWGASGETRKIDMLGGKIPWFLSGEKRWYWMNEYANKYPNSDKVKKWIKDGFVMVKKEVK